MGDATDLFDEVLRNTPASLSPFMAIDLVVTAQFFPVDSQRFTNQLWAFSLIFAVQAAVVAGSLVIRAKRQAEGFWLFRLTKAEGGSFITPHYASAWQLATLVFLITLIPYSLATLDFSEGNVPQNVMAWKLMPWIAAWSAAWLGTWAICVEGALLPATPAGRFNWIWTSAFVNSHFIGGGVACAIVMSTLAAISSQRYDKTLDILHTLQEELVTGGALFPNMTLEEVTANLAEPLVTTQTMLDSFHSFLSVFQLAWGGWVLFTAYLYMVFITVGMNHFVNLGTVVEKIEEKELGAESEAQNLLMEASLNASWWNMTWAVGLVTLACVVYGTNFIWLAVTADTSTQLPAVIQVETLAPLYGFAVFGTITCLLILHRALHITPPPFPSVLPTSSLEPPNPSPSDSSGSSSTLQPPSDFSLDEKCPPSPGIKVVTEWATPDEAAKKAEVAATTGSVRPSSEVLKQEFSFRLDTWEGDLPDLLSDEDVSDGTKTGDISPKADTPVASSPEASSP